MGMKPNVIAGIVILGVIGLLILAVILLRGGLPGSMVVTLKLEHAKGLEAGNSVYLQGVKVGEINSVELIPGGVEAKMRVYSKYESVIPQDSFLFVWTDNLISDKQCILIDPGQSSKPLEGGQEIPAASSKLEIGLHFGKDFSMDLASKIAELWEQRGKEQP